MMTSRNYLILALMLFLTGVVGALPMTACGEELVSISIPENALGLKEHERIASFEVNISGGQITSFPAMPSGWGICIYNESNKTARIGGNISVAAARVDSKFFKEFLFVRIWDDRFTISAKVGTLTDISLQERLIVLDMKDLLLRKVK